MPAYLFSTNPLRDEQAFFQMFLLCVMSPVSTSGLLISGQSITLLWVTPKYLPHGQDG